MQADSSDSSIMSIHSDDDTLMVLPYPGRGYGAERHPRSDTTATSSSSVGGSVAGDQDMSDESVVESDSESEASNNSDDETEPTSLLGVYPEVVNFFKAKFADIDMLIVHGLKVRKLITGFPLSLITLSSEVTRHRGMTERTTMEGGPG